MPNFAGQEKAKSKLHEVNMEITEEVTKVEIQEDSIVAAYERLNEVSFSRSVQRLRRNFRPQADTTTPAEEQLPRAS
ncbi:MAG: hypothetical protein ACXVBE_00835 [Bdellovibrionota bacterium]